MTKKKDKGSEAHAIRAANEVVEGEATLVPIDVRLALLLTISLHQNSKSQTITSVDGHQGHSHQG